MKPIILFLKSHVKGHTRRGKSGVVFVRDYTNRIRAQIQHGAAKRDGKTGDLFRTPILFPVAKASEPSSEDDEPRPMFVKRPVLNADELLAWAREQGFTSTLLADDLHVTQVFSKRPITRRGIADAPAEVRAVGGDRVVKPLGDQGAIVLMFDSPDLQARWRQFRDHGASWDYDAYRTHVTISYNAAGVDLSKVQPYTGTIIFGPEVFKPIDPDWKAKVKEQPLARTGAAS